MKKQLLAFLISGFILFPLYTIAQKPGSMTAVYGAGGRLEVFIGVSGNNGGVYHTWQRNEGGWQPVWQPYYPKPDDNPYGIVSGKDGEGRIMVAWLSIGKIYTATARSKDVGLTTYTTPRFTAPGGTNGFVFVSLAIANTHDGQIELLALTEAGRIFSFRELKQTDPIALDWKWETTFLGGSQVRNISVTNLNGRLMLAATGGDGKVYVKKQSSPGVWGSSNEGWLYLAGNKIERVYAQGSKDNQLEILALGTDRSLYLKYENLGSATWSAWRMLLDQRNTGRFAPPIFFERTKNGTLFLVSHKEAGNTQYIGTFGKAFQLPNNGGWPPYFYSFHAPANPSDFLGFLNPKAFALVADKNGAFHYFACYRQTPRVEHYIDYKTASADRSLAFEHQEHEMPDLPFTKVEW